VTPISPVQILWFLLSSSRHVRRIYLLFSSWHRLRSSPVRSTNGSWSWALGRL